MTDLIKLELDGTCKACNFVSMTTDNVQCFMCNDLFHGACPQIKDEERVCAKSTITAFNRVSTKSNFQFFCDPCITKLETNRAGSEANRLNILEGSMSSIKEEIREIKNLLKQGKPALKQTRSDNIWHNKEKLMSIKAAPDEPRLVVKNAQEADNITLEKAIVDNAIPVTKSYKNNSGGLVLVCDTADSRDKLKDIITSTSNNIQLESVTRKKPTITIVGLSKEYK